MTYAYSNRFILDINCGKILTVLSMIEVIIDDTFLQTMS